MTVPASSDPFQLFEAWMQEASASEPNDANAMALATIDADGQPTVRIVLLKGLDDQGFVFYTNLESDKGRQLLARPKASLNFHWKSLERQIRIDGGVEQVSDDEADAYYATRPRGSQIGAWASDQSRPLEDRALLEKRVADCEARFEGGDVPRPPHWSGFRVVPARIEFWQGMPYRLHDRVVYSRQAEGWTTQRLFP